MHIAYVLFLIWIDSYFYSASPIYLFNTNFQPTAKIWGVFFCLFVMLLLFVHFQIFKNMFLLYVTHSEQFRFQFQTNLSLEWAEFHRGQFYPSLCIPFSTEKLEEGTKWISYTKQTKVCRHCRKGNSHYPYSLLSMTGNTMGRTWKFPVKCTLSTHLCDRSKSS